MYISLFLSLSLSLYIYIYIYVSLYIYIYICISESYSRPPGDHLPIQDLSRLFERTSITNTRSTIPESRVLVILILSRDLFDLILLMLDRRFRSLDSYRSPDSRSMIPESSCRFYDSGVSIAIVLQTLDRRFRSLE